jgi:hypothetical protein
MLFFVRTFYLLSDTDASRAKHTIVNGVTSVHHMNDGFWFLSRNWSFEPETKSRIEICIKLASLQNGMIQSIFYFSSSNLIFFQHSLVLVGVENFAIGIEFFDAVRLKDLVTQKLCNAMKNVAIRRDFHDSRVNFLKFSSTFCKVLHVIPTPSCKLFKVPPALSASAATAS